MAEAKAKVPIALPKSGGGGGGDSTAATPSSISLEVALKNAIGSRIRITTPTGTQEGVLFTADPITSLLALQTSSTSSTTSSSSTTFPSGSYKILPLSSVSSFTLLSSAPASTTNLSISPLPLPALQARHSSALASAQSALLRIGPPGTSPLAQALFDGLARTFSGGQVRWSGTDMLVSDSMVIGYPYGEGEVRLREGMRGRVGEVERIRKVVGMEREKGRLKGLKDQDTDGGRSGGAGGTAERKGG